MNAGQALGGEATDVAARDRHLVGAPECSGVVVPLPLRVNVTTTSSSAVDLLAERVVPLVMSRIEGFRLAESRPPTLREIVAVAVEAVIDTQAVDRLHKALNEQEAMP